MSLYNLTNPDLGTIPIEGQVLFGRGSECDIRLKDSEVSRKHATVYITDQKPFVIDEGSANGTFVNGVRIQGPTALSAGSQIRMGKTIFKLEATDVEDVTPTVFANQLELEPPEEPTSLDFEPVAQVSAPEDVSIPGIPPTKKKRSPLILIGIGCGALILIAICVLAALFALNRSGILNSPLGNLNLSSGRMPDYSLEEVLSEEINDDRPEVISYLGLPDAFTISEIMLEGTPVRVETWLYFAFGTRVDFVDGEVTWTMDIEPAPEDSILPAWYDPMAFELGMSQDEAARVAAAASPAGMSPEWIDLADAGEELVGGSMLVGDQIILGLDESGLIYVETIGLFPEGEGGF
jgi:pSer/pThr/pTyr-binding forkhead associated (FHA) protein